MCTDYTEAEFVGFSVTSERSHHNYILMFSTGFDERPISAQSTSPPIVIATAHTVCMVRHCGGQGDLGMLLAGKEWVAGMEDGVGQAATLHAPLVRFPQVTGWFVAARVHGP